MGYLIIAFMGLLLGMIAVLIYNNYYKNNQHNLKKESNVLLERIEKVFKVVLAEGHFSEIHDFKTTEPVMWGAFTNNKKAILLTNSKVLVGFDFAKFRYTATEGSRQLVIDYLPEPEILSIDTNVKFYDLDANAFSRFSPEQLTEMQQQAKAEIAQKVKESHLFVTAKQQLNEMLKQMSLSVNWQMNFSLNSGSGMLNEKNAE